jgi:hypothetical protein
VRTANLPVVEQPPGRESEPGPEQPGGVAEVDAEALSPYRPARYADELAEILLVGIRRP